jgi:hypothetical protein
MSFLTAVQAHAASTAAQNNFATSNLSALVSDAINSAIASGQFSVTLNLAGYATQLLSAGSTYLTGQGYTVSMVGTTATISW